MMMQIYHIYTAHRYRSNVAVPLETMGGVLSSVAHRKARKTP